MVLNCRLTNITTKSFVNLLFSAYWIEVCFLWANQVKHWWLDVRQRCLNVHRNITSWMSWQVNGKRDQFRSAFGTYLCVMADLTARPQPTKQTAVRTIHSRWWGEHPLLLSPRVFEFRGYFTMLTGEWRRVLHGEIGGWYLIGLCFSPVIFSSFK